MEAKRMECNENGTLKRMLILNDDNEYISIYSRQDIQELIKVIGTSENDLCKINPFN